MALLESFVIHVRSLVDFFYKRSSRYETAAFAWHFFHRRQTWQDARPQPGPWITVVRDPLLSTDRIGAEIVHLSYNRIELSEEARGWPVTQIAHALGSVVHCFVENVPDRNVGADFKRRATAEVPLTARLPQGVGVLPPFWAGPARTRGA